MPHSPLSIECRLGLTAPGATAKPRGVFRNSILSGSVAALSVALLAVTAVAQTTPPTGGVPRPNAVPLPPSSAKPATGTAPTPATPPAGPSPTAPAPAPASDAPVPGLPQPGGAVPAVTPPVTNLPSRQATSFSNATSPTGEKLIRLDYQNTDVKDVLNFYQQLTGVKFIFNTQLMGGITINSMEVPKSEAIKIIELSLQINGVYIEPVDGEPGIMRVSAMNQTPRPLGIPFIDSEAALSVVPQVSEQVVTYLMKLQFADPTEMAQIITSALSSQNPSGYAAVVPLPKANAILITDTVPFVRSIINFVKKADVAPAEVESLFITLRYAQAEDVVANLEKLFEKTQTPTTSTPVAAVAPQQGGRFRGQGGQGGPGAAIGGAPVAPAAEAVSAEGASVGTGPTEDSIIIGKVKITADKRTNRIHIVSRPVNMPFIKALIAEYDADVPLPEPAVRPLKYRAVSEVIDAVVAAIKDPGEKDAAGGPGGSGLGQNARPGTQANNNQFNNAGGNRGGNNTNSSLGGSSSDTAGALGESLSTQERDTTPIAQQVGKSTIIADPFSNTIVVVGTTDVKQKVLTLLDELDQQQPQVMIEVVIGELKLQKDESYGIDYILKNGPALNSTNNPISGGTTTGGTTTNTSGIVGFNDLGRPVLNLNGLLNQQAVSRIATAGAGGFSGYFTAGDAFTSVVNLLQSTDRFRVISTPKVFTSSNKRAIITSGEEVPVPANITSGFGGATGNNLQTTSSIQYKPIELRLEVLPLINSDRDVQLEVVQNISDRSGNTVIDGNSIPNVTRRAIKTYVTVPNKSTLILGGLIKDSQDHTRTGVPWLSTLPIVGPFFGNTVKNKTRSELIILMRPVVTTNLVETNKLREKTFENFTIPPDFDQAIVPPGIRQKAIVPRILAPIPRETAPPLRVEPAAETTTTTTVKTTALTPKKATRKH